MSRAERRALGTRTGSRLLTCFQQALLVLVWLRTRQDIAVVGGVPTPRTGFSVAHEGGARQVR